ncbi:hypothetical protein VD0002_g4545 [Verticillium dahliae]|uniref:Uncharacterized protein n=1 Tax=Verticillium dahliae TaxID=27337 RepID=A0AA44W7K5_VERDA|nr:hypothetical protein EV126DRAFT_42323 [Verticillium dahliae]PNH26334.1 hypothetical protein BJF96_g10358 [Verticillium dahliae]PNH63961.1 hypothetical protein VD0002_g4545 [Verticillium dahliae]RBQ88127.1 hypothetical protein VDGD_07171 [Verticillium dahliae]
MRLTFSFLLNVSLSLAQLTTSSLEKHVDSATLAHSYNPVKEAYWTGYPHHRRTPFALSPDGKTAYLAYLDASETDVHVQPINPTTFAATGTSVTIKGAKEAGGLVAHDDGFALLTNEALPSGTSNAPAGNTPVPVLYRYNAAGTQSWKTFLGGPGVDAENGLVASPDLNGDLVFSAEAGYYAAYFVVTAYSGWAEGHFGDAIRYVKPDGTLENIPGASSSWGCSHNTGIAFEAADAPPYASICAEDQGAIWLNTKTQGMGNNGVKVSNEKVINGGSNEPMGGTSGSYSGLARFGSASEYIFSWVSRGAIDLTANDWMGAGYTKSANRTSNRNVAIALFSDKSTIVGEQATSVVGAADGDKQINWVTEGTADCSNAHVAAFDASQALVTWEEIASPICDFEAMGCRGKFTGTHYQLVNKAGEKVGSPIESLDTTVSGDLVTMSDGRICWPYVNMEWRLDAVTRALPDSTTSDISFACISLGGASSPAEPAPEAPASSAAAAPVSSAAETEAAETVETEAAAPVVPAPAASEPVAAESAAPVDSASTVEAALPVSPEASEPAAPVDESSSIPAAVPTAPVAEQPPTDVVESNAPVAPAPEITEAPVAPTPTDGYELPATSKKCKTQRTVWVTVTVSA